MTSLPPLADIVAYADSDAGTLARMEERLRAAERFEAVWRPAEGWVVGFAALPGSPPVPDVARSAGLVFVQGADIVLAGDAQAAAARVTELASTRPEQLDALPGDFGFVHFRDRGAATVVRACGGPVPLNVAGDGRWSAIGTRLTDLADLVPQCSEPDLFVHAAQTAGFARFPDDRSFLAGVRVLPRGHAAVLTPGRSARFVEYWSPRRAALEPPGSLPSHAAELRLLLLDTLERDLDARSGNLLSLSGGLDSSCLAAVVTGTLGRPLASVSFVPTHEPARRQLQPRIDRIVQECGLDHADVRPLSTGHRLELLERPPPLAVQVPHPVLAALPDIAERQPVKVLVGGESADEVCGSALTFADWAAHTSPFRLLRRTNLPNGPRDRLRWARRRLRNAVGRPEIPLALELHEMFRPELQDEYREWRGRVGRNARLDRGTRRGLALQVANDSWLTQNWEVCSSLGIRRSVPFLTRGMLELAFRCHPADLVGPGTKRLLRTALAGDVPDDVLSSYGKGVFSPVDPPPADWQPPPLDELEPLLAPGWPAPDQTYTAADALVLTKLAVPLCRALSSPLLP